MGCITHTQTHRHTCFIFAIFVFLFRFRTFRSFAFFVCFLIPVECLFRGRGGEESILHWLHRVDQPSGPEPVTQLRLHTPCTHVHAPSTYAMRPFRCMSFCIIILFPSPRATPTKRQWSHDGRNTHIPQRMRHPPVHGQGLAPFSLSIA
jgi:hypothetical protein